MVSDDRERTDLVGFICAVYTAELPNTLEERCELREMRQTE